ncbi:MAG: thioesterase family protein [Variovorax sp.]
MTGPVFSRERPIRFSDCDPAGIVFYPQYFVMMNGLVEDWFTEALGVDYAALINERRIGLPTVRLAVDFKSIARLGDKVRLTLQCERVGGASLSLKLRCLGLGADDDDSVRMTMNQVVVTTSLESHRAVEIPADLRAAIGRWSNA